jgi:hypothetical protein
VAILGQNIRTGLVFAPYPVCLYFQVCLQKYEHNCDLEVVFTLDLIVLSAAVARRLSGETSLHSLQVPLPSKTSLCKVRRLRYFSQANSFTQGQTKYSASRKPCVCSSFSVL